MSLKHRVSKLEAAKGGEAEVWVSWDDGATWKKPGTDVILTREQLDEREAASRTEFTLIQVVYVEQPEPAWRKK